MKPRKPYGSASATRRRFLCAAGAAAATARGTSPVRVEDTKGERVSVFCDGRSLLDYRYDRARPKPYVHPLYLPDGNPATLDGPRDHVHHRGLMVAWSAVNGYDFWGEVNPARHGQIVHQRFLRCEGGDAAVIEALNDWVAEGKLLLQERRTITVPPPLPEGVWLDWVSEFEAAGTVSLGPGDHVYNGLGIRTVAAMDAGAVLNSRGTASVPKANGERATWCAYYGQAAGVAIFDHPSNPRHPTPFFVMNQRFGYLAAAPTFTKEPFALAPGGRIRFRWGVLAYLGEPRGDVLDRCFRTWTIVRSQGTPLEAQPR